MVADSVGAASQVVSPPEDLWGFVGARRPDPRGWVIVWSVTPPDWAVVRHPDMPEGLQLRVRTAPTEDGFAIVAVLVEREDGRAVSARDLRKVKLPPAWALAPFMAPRPGTPQVGPARPGRRGKTDDHWRAVFGLWREARKVAPLAPVRWMRAQWPGEPSDATMRRWITRARERAEAGGWDKAEP